MSNAQENLDKFKIILPEPKDPVGSYLATKKVGKLITKVIKGLSENPEDNSKVESEVRNENTVGWTQKRSSIPP